MPKKNLLFLLISTLLLWMSPKAIMTGYSIKKWGFFLLFSCCGCKGFSTDKAMHSERRKRHHVGLIFLVGVQWQRFGSEPHRGFLLCRQNGANDIHDARENTQTKDIVWGCLSTIFTPACWSTLGFVQSRCCRPRFPSPSWGGGCYLTWFNSPNPPRKLC